MKLLIRLPTFARVLERGATVAAIMGACIVSAQNSQTTVPDANSQGAGAANLQNKSSDTTDTGAKADASGKEKETSDSSALTAESFIKEAAKGNNFEIAMAEIAERKAQDSQVKQYAAMLRREHQKANDQLKPIARAHGVSLTTAEGNMHEDKMHDLNQASGSEFDKQYITDMLRDHQKDIAKFEKASQQLQDSDVKQYAENTLPTLRQHLQRAKQAAQAIGISEPEVSSILSESPDAVGGTDEKQEHQSGTSTNNPHLNIEPNP